jgi:hypothetical protein
MSPEGQAGPELIRTPSISSTLVHLPHALTKRSILETNTEACPSPAEINIRMTMLGRQCRPLSVLQRRTAVVVNANDGT